MNDTCPINTNIGRQSSKEVILHNRLFVPGYEDYFRGEIYSNALIFIVGLITNIPFLLS